MDTISQLQLFKSSLPDKPLCLSTQEQYLSSRSHVEAMKAWLAKCDSHHAEIIEAAKVAYDTAKRKAHDARKDVAELYDQYIAEQKRFLTWQRTETEKQIAEAAATIVQSRNESLAQSAIEAAKQGDVEQATKLFQASESTTLSFVPEPVREPDTTTTWGYEIVDVSKLNNEYVNRVPNRGKIRATVTKHHENAEEIVGRGSIVVNKNVSPRYAKESE